MKIFEIFNRIEVLLLLTILLAIEAGYYDGKEINFECYHGSIAKCDALREWVFGLGWPSVMGMIFGGLTLLLWWRWRT